MSISCMHNLMLDNKVMPMTCAAFGIGCAIAILAAGEGAHIVRTDMGIYGMQAQILPS